MPFTSQQTGGNLNVVVVGWNDTAANVTSVTDSAGNAYELAAPMIRGTALSQAIYFAKNTVAATTNTVMVAFDRPAIYVDVRIAEYSGLSRTNPLDVSASAAGTATTANSTAATTTSPEALLIGSGTTFNTFTAAGTGYTTRLITVPDGSILEDRIVTAVGSYSATALQQTTGPWVMQMVAFRAAVVT